jgi:hypothetical protein
MNGTLFATDSFESFQADVDKVKYRKTSGSSHTKQMEISYNQIIKIDAAEHDQNLKSQKHLKALLENNKGKFTTREGKEFDIFYSKEFTDSNIIVDFKLLPMFPEVNLDFSFGQQNQQSVLSHKNRVVFHYLKGKKQLKLEQKISDKKHRQIQKIKEANHSHELFNRKVFEEPCLESLFPKVFNPDLLKNNFQSPDIRYSSLGEFSMSTVFRQNSIFKEDLPNAFHFLADRKLMLMARGYFGFDSKCYNHGGKAVHANTHGHIEIKDNDAPHEVPQEIGVFSRKSDVLGFLKDNEQVYDSVLFMMKYLCKCFFFLCYVLSFCFCN